MSIRKKYLLFCFSELCPLALQEQNMLVSSTVIHKAGHRAFELVRNLKFCILPGCWRKSRIWLPCTFGLGLGELRKWQYLARSFETSPMKIPTEVSSAGSASASAAGCPLLASGCLWQCPGFVAMWFWTQCYVIILCYVILDTMFLTCKMEFMTVSVSKGCYKD